MESDLTSLSLETADTTGSATLATGRELLTQLRSTEAVGRLVIDLEQLLVGDRGRASDFANLELRNQDRLLVPKQAQEVTVIGETQQNTSHLYRPELTRRDYIAMSGGLTRRADRGLIYVVRASGTVVTGNRSRWFGRGGNLDIRPGDTIVVPLETDPGPPVDVLDQHNVDTLQRVDRDRRGRHVWKLEHRRSSQPSQVREKESIGGRAVV